MSIAEVAVPSRMTPWTSRILRAARETRDVFTLDLDLAGRPGGLPFRPGQFNMLYLYGVGEVAISISGDPARPDRLSHTIRAVGSVTQAMQRLKKGAVLGVRGPYGKPWPVDALEGRDVVIVAGGLGLAPLRPVMYALLADRARFARITLLYGARTPDDLVFRRQVEAWRGRFDVDVHVTVDRAGKDWGGHVGVVTELLPHLHGVRADTAAFVCGPEIMMRFAVRALEDDGVSPDHLWVSMERSMKCGIGLCGHCQFGPTFVCRDGPVYRYDRVASLITAREI
jgi:NAD(P)H-flavin reductase